MQFQPERSLYAFWRGIGRDQMRFTVCRFCRQSLARSAEPRNLLIAEKHHCCLKMREFLASYTSRLSHGPEQFD